jgi:rhodanese-related sulfurtransferase
MGLLDMFGFGKKKKMMLELMAQGALVVDVRSQGEFAMGHVEGSINVPLDSIKHKAGKLKKLNKPLVLCCASGMRSGSAMHILRKEGIECYNGGGWRRLA